MFIRLFIEKDIGERNKMNLSKVFVYGLLLNQFKNEPAILKDYDKFIRGFPTIRRKEGASVNGQFIKVNDKTLEMLDRIESKGTFYDRIKVDIWVGDKDSCHEVKNVWVYQQIEDIKNAVLL